MTAVELVFSSVRNVHRHQLRTTAVGSRVGDDGELVVTSRVTPDVRSACDERENYSVVRRTYIIYKRIVIF